MPIALIIQGVTAVLAGAPQFMLAAQQAYTFIASMFKAGLITKAEQDACFDKVDAIIKARLRGEKPAHWTVEPDPISADPVVSIAAPDPNPVPLPGGVSATIADAVGAHAVTKVTKMESGREVWCDPYGDCWVVWPPEMTTKIADGHTVYSSPNGWTFIMLADR